MTTTTPSSTARDYESAFDALDRALDDHGLRMADVVRSRLTAATRAGRDAGSIVRLRRLAVPFPCATSSYIDPSRFDRGDGATLETLALRGAGDGKLAVENRPSPPPWRAVATGDLVFFSGITSFETELDDQLDDIGSRVAAALLLARTLLGRPVRAWRAAAYVQRDLDHPAIGDLAARVGLEGVPLEIARCSGFSFPSKIVEIEIDGVADPAG